MRIVLESDKRVETTIDVDSTRTVTEKARVAEVVIDNRRVVDSVPTTDDGLVVYRIREADAWSNISSVRIDESEVRSLESTLANCSDDGSASPACRRVRCVGIKAAQEAARLFSRTTVVVSDTKIYGQFRRNLDVVLSKERIRKKSQCRDLSSGCC